MKKYGYLMIYEIRGAWTIFKFLWTNRSELVGKVLLFSMHLVDKKGLDALLEMVEKARMEEEQRCWEGHVKG